MSFETVMVFGGRLLDKIVAWYLSLPWYYSILLCMIYFIIILYWVYNRYRTGGSPI